MPEQRTWVCPRCGLHVTETPPAAPPEKPIHLLLGACPRCGLANGEHVTFAAGGGSADPRRVRVSEARRQQPV